MADTLTARDIVNEAFGSDDEEAPEMTETADDGDEGVSGAEGIDVTDRSDDTDGEEPSGVGVDRGDGRDSTGKWVSKSPEPIADPTEQAPPAAEEAPKPVADAAPAQPATPTEPEGQPWRVKVQGAEYETGATYVPGKGLTVPESSMQAFQTAVQEGVYYKAHWQRLEQEATDKGKAEGKALGDRILDQIAGFAEQVASGDPEKQLAVLQWFMQYNQNLPRLQAELERDQLKAQLESRNQGEKRQAEEAQTTQLATQKAAFVKSELSTMLSDPSVSVLTKEDKAAIEKQVQAFESSLWVQQDGEWHLDTDKLAAIITGRAEVRSEAIKAAKAAQDASKFNKGAQQAPKGSATPAKSAAKPGRQAEEAEMTPAEWKRKFKDEWRSTPGLPADDDDE